MFFAIDENFGNFEQAETLAELSKKLDFDNFQNMTFIKGEIINMALELKEIDAY